MKVGLRVDVDTYRGTRDGVVKLLDIFRAHQTRASFFFSVGPDNMGRHIWRLFRPAFLIKMLRSRAAKLYGWDIIFKGILWPGPLIGEKLADIIRSTAEAGHEVGLHAWDHHAWQTHIDHMHRETIAQILDKGVDTLTRILGHVPTCSAVAGWKCTEDVLLEKNRFPFVYNSDCRGRSIFRPIVNGTLCTPQIPVTLPTYDEVIGRGGIADTNYNDYILSLMKPQDLNVLAVHAEVEGIVCAGLFNLFLDKAADQGITLFPLGRLLPPTEGIATSTIEAADVFGREGWVCLQTGTDVPEPEYKK